MADLSITATSVRGYGDRLTGVAGGTITAGMALKKNTSLQLVAATSDSAVNSTVVGIALNNASANQPVDYQSSGLIDMGATLLLAKIYVLSTASGAIKPVDDIAGTEYISIIGGASTTSRMKLSLNNLGAIASAAVT